jgi:hypothetical protein
MHRRWRMLARQHRYHRRMCSSSSSSSPLHRFFKLNTVVVDSWSLNLSGAATPARAAARCTARRVQVSIDQRTNIDEVSICFSSRTTFNFRLFRFSDLLQRERIMVAHHV